MRTKRQGGFGTFCAALALALASYGLAGCVRWKTRIVKVPVAATPCMSQVEVARVEEAIKSMYSTPASQCYGADGKPAKGLCFPDPDGHTVSGDIAATVDFARDRVARCPKESGDTDE